MSDVNILRIGFDINGNSRYKVSAADMRMTPNEASKALPAGRRCKNGMVSFQAYAGDPSGTIAAAMSGMRIADWFDRRDSMRKHPAGKALE